MASYTGSLQYEDSISCALYRFLLPLRRQFDFAPFFVVERNFFVLSKKSSSAFSLVDFIHPSILSTAFSSSSKRCFTRILLLCQVFGLVLVVLSPILDRLPIHSRLLVFINPPLFALWVSMFRDLCSVRIFISPHRFRLRLVSLFEPR